MKTSLVCNNIGRAIQVLNKGAEPSPVQIGQFKPVLLVGKDFTLTRPRVS